MRSRIDHDSPVPLYHQIVRALEYRIATGDLRPGDHLPTLRTAGEEWGVNLHTVRRAYQVLTEQRTLVTKPGVGSVVAQGVEWVPEGIECWRPPDEPWSDTPAATLDGFLGAMLRTAHDRWGASPDEVVRRLHHLRPNTVWVVECSEIQSADLADQVRAVCDARVQPRSLERSEELPPGLVIATHFHFADIRRRWPHRLGEIHFIAIRPDPRIRDRVLARVAGLKNPRVAICEREPAMAANVAADLRPMLQGVAEVEIAVERVAAHFLSNCSPDTTLLFAPRVWAELSAEERADPRAVEVRYLIGSTDLEGIRVAVGETSTCTAEPSV